MRMDMRMDVLACMDIDVNTDMRTDECVDMRTDTVCRPVMGVPLCVSMTSSRSTSLRGSIARV